MNNSETKNRQFKAQRKNPFEFRFLANVRVGMKLGLVIAIMLIGIATIFFASFEGLRTINVHMTHLYKNAVIPISNISQADTELANIEAQTESLRNPNLSVVERVNRIETILSSEVVFNPILKKYDDEWVTTKNPDFTALLRDTGNLNLQKDELATLAALHSSYDSYLTARQAYQATVQSGHTDDNLEGAARSALFETRRHLQHLIDINNKYAQLTNTAAQDASRQVENFMGIVLVLTIALGLILVYAISASINNRLRVVEKAASEMQKGNLTQDVAKAVGGSDEIYALAGAFDNMASQVGGLITGLEERVQERTSELENANLQNKRRAEQFETIAAVAHAISSTQNLQNLLPQISKTISQHFGFYHVGVFLLDKEREYAVLQAANSEGGQRMLKRGHRLKVGEVGIVGYVTSTGNPRVALDTGTDAVYFNNPDLPDTHSEIALPLKIGAEIIGALDVQSTDANAFSDDDAKVLTALANQVSIAIQNSRLYDETRKAVAETEALYSEFIREGWRQFSEAKRITGIRRKSGKTMILTETAETHPASKQTITETSDATSLKLPIKLRAETIGMLNIKAPETREWTQDEIDIINAIIERAAISLENARLLEDAQRRAKKERIIGEITTKISSSINMRNVLQTAVEELGRAIPGSDVIIQFQPDTENGKG
jgi:GAF domain-containing protein/HAMP domain-containing protein